MTGRTRIGVVGLGEIAQLMHLPALAASSDFEISAVCDVSRELADYVGARYSVPTRATDFRQMLDDVDAVAILTMEHAEIAEAAAERGKHIFVEKPLSFSPESCDRIVSAVKRAGTVCMVGYMRVYDPAYTRALECLEGCDDISLVRAHDFGGSFSVHPKLYGLRYPGDIDESARAALQERIDLEMRRALGVSHQHLTQLYFEVLMSGIHDLSMLRATLGQAREVVSSTSLTSDGLLSVLSYPGDAMAELELRSTTTHSWWDQSLAVFGNDRTVTLEFPSPFIRNAPTILTVQQEGSFPVRHGPVSYESPFSVEWDRFAACIRGEAEPLTTAEDAAADVRLALAIVEALPAEGEQ